MAGDLTRTSKPCAKCGEDLPFSKFDIDRSKADGYKAICKPCRKEIADHKRLKDASDILGKLDLALVAALAGSKSGGTDLPHVAETFQAITRLLGGVEGVARQFLANYYAAKPGSLTRERMLSQWLKMNETISDSNKVEMPVELMSDQDLEREVAARKKSVMLEGEVTQVEVIHDDELRSQET